MSEPLNPTPNRFVLRDLPFAARLTLAVVLISIGIGYFSALVQLHFQHASPGQLLPTADDAVRTFSGPQGDKPKSHIAILLEADENLPWNGSGQMSAAFTKRSESWKSAIKAKARELAGVRGRRGGADLDLAAAEKALRAERDTERQAILAWIEAGAPKEDYDKDRFCLSAELAKRPLTKAYRGQAEDGAVCAKIKSILGDRCLRCHQDGGEDAKAAAEDKRLDTWPKLAKYVTAKPGGGAMDLTKLAQTTHVHLLGFSMLYGITGFIFAFTSLPGLVRVLIAPLPLLAQIADISCWWLARFDAPHGPMFAKIIPITGGLVALGLGLHILISLFDLFGRWGKLLLFVLIVAAGGGAYLVKEKVIDPHIAGEKPPQKAQK